MSEEVQPKRAKLVKRETHCTVVTRSSYLRKLTGALPDELWLKILGFLSTRDISIMRATCRRLNELSKDVSLWKNMEFDIASVNVHFLAVERVIGRATQAREIQFTNIGNKDVDSTAVASLVVRAKKTLKVLKLSPMIPLGKEAMRRFGCLVELEVLNIASTINPLGLKAFAKLKSLRELRISEIVEFRNIDLKFLFQELKNLVVVDLGFNLMNSDTFSTLIKNNPKLETFKCDCPDSNNVSFVDLSRNCPNLKNLDLRYWTRLRDGEINHLIHSKNIESLDLGFCFHLSDRTLQNIAKNCSELRYLNLSGCIFIKDDGIRVLAQNCPNLEALNIWGCEAFSKEVVEELVVVCKKLTELRIYYMFDDTPQFKKRLRKKYPKLTIF